MGEIGGILLFFQLQRSSFVVLIYLILFQFSKLAAAPSPRPEKQTEPKPVQASNNPLTKEGGRKAPKLCILQH